MSIDDEQIIDILLKEAYVTQEDLEKAKQYAEKHHASIVDYFLSEQLLTEDIIGQAVAEFYKVPYADLNSNQPDREQVLFIPEETAKKFRVVLFKQEEKQCVVATDKPDQKIDQLNELKELFPKKKIIAAYALSEDIDISFLQYRKALDTRFEKIIQDQKRIAPEIIDEILGDAVGFRASDIHFDPQEQEVVIRFRIDGVLHEAGRIQKKYYENIVNRIKVQAKLRIDEHYSPQDGAMRYVKYGTSLDIRISIAPTIDGEKVVLRLLSEYVRSFTFADIGLSAEDETIVMRAAKKPFGMILVTGPTGSGKTTTLYTLIKLLNQPEVNIATIEDPVEYKVAGVNHIQVNHQANVTFASGLRSIVRQDPNIILVGEIRDKETAEIAVNAALTGHLLLSTFHANDAATAVPRLLDMGIEPFLLSSTLELLIAQRLVRRICEKCRYSYRIKPSDIKEGNYELGEYFSGTTVTLYKGKGCQTCGNTGYKGRIAVYELIKSTGELQDLILKHPSSKEIWEVARAQGSHTLFEDGLLKVKNGITTIQEVIRVAPPNTSVFMPKKEAVPVYAPVRKRKKSGK